MKHGTLHAYANLRCRCDLCRERWNQRGRSRNRAIAALIARHDAEFRQLWDAETEKAASA